MSDLMEDLELWLQNRLEQVNTLIPGKVQSYDATTRMAVVKPSVKFRTMHADVFDIPPIADVPVIWPGCSSFSEEGELQYGDGVLLLFAQQGIGNWQRGTTDVDVEDQTRFSLQDAVAIPGLWQTRLVPKHKGRSAHWGMRSESLSIGGTKDGKAVVENDTTDLRAEIEKLWTRLATLSLNVQLSMSTLNAAAVGPLAPLQPGFAALNAACATENLPTGIPLDKAALKGLLA